MGILENINFSDLQLSKFGNIKCPCELCDDGYFFFKFKIKKKLLFVYKTDVLTDLNILIILSVLEKKLKKSKDHVLN